MLVRFNSYTIIYHEFFLNLAYNTHCSGSRPRPGRPNSCRRAAPAWRRNWSRAAFGAPRAAPGGTTAANSHIPADCRPAGDASALAARRRHPPGSAESGCRTGSCAGVKRKLFDLIVENAFYLRKVSDNCKFTPSLVPKHHAQKTSFFQCDSEVFCFFPRFPPTPFREIFRCG